MEYDTRFLLDQIAEPTATSVSQAGTKELMENDDGDDAALDRLIHLFSFDVVQNFRISAKNQTTVDIPLREETLLQRLRPSTPSDANGTSTRGALFSQREKTDLVTTNTVNENKNSTNRITRRQTVFESAQQDHQPEQFHRRIGGFQFDRVSSGNVRNSSEGNLKFVVR